MTKKKKKLDSIIFGVVLPEGFGFYFQQKKRKRVLVEVDINVPVKVFKVLHELVEEKSLIDKLLIDSSQESYSEVLFKYLNLSHSRDVRDLCSYGEKIEDVLQFERLCKRKIVEEINTEFYRQELKPSKDLARKIEFEISEKLNVFINGITSLVDKKWDKYLDFIKHELRVRELFDISYMQLFKDSEDCLRFQRLNENKIKEYIKVLQNSNLVGEDTLNEYELLCVMSNEITEKIGYNLLAVRFPVNTEPNEKEQEFFLFKLDKGKVINPTVFVTTISNIEKTESFYLQNKDDCYFISAGISIKYYKVLECFKMSIPYVESVELNENGRFTWKINNVSSMKIVEDHYYLGYFFFNMRCPVFVPYRYIFPILPCFNSLEARSNIILDLILPNDFKFVRNRYLNLIERLSIESVLEDIIISLEERLYDVNESISYHKYRNIRLNKSNAPQNKLNAILSVFNMHTRMVSKSAKEHQFIIGDIKSLEDDVFGKKGEMALNRFFMMDEICERLNNFRITWENKTKESFLPYDFLIENEEQSVFLEVKATRSSSDSVFYVSVNELKKMLEDPNRYILCRLVSIGTEEMRGVPINEDFIANFYVFSESTVKLVQAKLSEWEEYYEEKKIRFKVEHLKSLSLLDLEIKPDLPDYDFIDIVDFDIDYLREKVVSIVKESTFGALKLQLQDLQEYYAINEFMRNEIEFLHSEFQQQVDRIIENIKNGCSLADILSQVKTGNHYCYY